MAWSKLVTRFRRIWGKICRSFMSAGPTNFYKSFRGREIETDLNLCTLFTKLNLFLLTIITNLLFWPLVFLPTLHCNYYICSSLNKSKYFYALHKINCVNFDHLPPQPALRSFFNHNFLLPCTLLVSTLILNYLPLPESSFHSSQINNHVNLATFVLHWSLVLRTFKRNIIISYSILAYCHGKWKRLGKQPSLSVVYSFVE